MYIAKERKLSSVNGAGVQFLYGHDEPFVDYILEKYLPVEGQMLDLGGGGFRLAIPAALRGRRVTVVDLDPEALDLKGIAKRVNENGRVRLDVADVLDKIIPRQGSVFDYLEASAQTYSFVSAIRLVHFFDTQQCERFFSLVSARLESGAVFILSGLIPYDNLAPGTHNEFYTHSSSASQDNPLYRKFNDTVEARALQEAQNFGVYFHLVSREFIESIGAKNGLELVESDIRSTRVVSGYVLQKR